MTCSLRCHSTENSTPGQYAHLLGDDLQHHLRGAAADAHRDSPLASKARLGALYDALDADGAPSPDTLLAAVRARLGAWPTTLEDDEQTFEQLRGESGIDPRAAAVLAYRIGLKRQFALAEAVLATYCA